MTRWARRAAAGLPVVLALLGATPAPALTLPLVQAPTASNPGTGPEDLLATVLFQGQPIPIIGHIDAAPAPPSSPPAPAPGDPSHGGDGTQPQANGAGQHWCGGARSNDVAGSPDHPYVQLVYAFPNDRPDHLAAFRDVLQGNASVIRSFLAAQSGGHKTLRFAGEGACGVGGADIGALPLSGPRSAYLTNGGAPSVEALGREVKAAFPAQHSVPVNYLVFVDNLASPSACQCITGTGEHYEDSAKASPSVHDAGGLTAAVWGVDGWTPEAGATSYLPDLFLHEITHTLGGVAGDAPHSTGAGHCTDQADVMCYADGGPKNAMSTPCPVLTGIIGAAFDCGQDDYFNPAPAPGSYLATHWNVYDSAFLERAVDVGVGGDPPAAHTAAAPVRTVRRLHAVLRTPGGTRAGLAILEVSRASAGRIVLVEPALGLRLRGAPHRASLRVVLCAWHAAARGRVLGIRRCVSHAGTPGAGHTAVLHLPRLRLATHSGHLRTSLSVLARDTSGNWRPFASTAARGLPVAL